MSGVAGLSMRGSEAFQCAESSEACHCILCAATVLCSCPVVPHAQATVVFMSAGVYCGTGGRSLLVPWLGLSWRVPAQEQCGVA